MPSNTAAVAGRTRSPRSRPPIPGGSSHPGARQRLRAGHRFDVAQHESREDEDLVVEHRGLIMLKHSRREWISIAAAPPSSWISRSHQGKNKPICQPPMNANLELNDKSWSFMCRRSYQHECRIAPHRGKRPARRSRGNSAKMDTFKVDLTSAKMIDSVGLNLVVTWLKRTQKLGAKMQVAYSNANVLRTFIFTRLDKHIELVKV